MSSLDDKLNELKKSGPENNDSVSNSRSIGVAIGSLFLGGLIIGPFVSIIIFQILEIIYGSVQSYITSNCGTYMHYNMNAIDWWFKSNYECDSYNITGLGYFVLAPLNTYLLYIIIRSIGFKLKYFTTQTSLIKSKFIFIMIFYFIVAILLSLRPHGKVMNTSLDTFIIFLFDIYLLIQVIGYEKIKGYLKKSKIKN